MPSSYRSPSGAPHVPASSLRKHRRSLWARVALVAILGLTLAGAAVPMRRHEQVLDRRGVETQAKVIEIDYERRLPDEAMVVYEVEGSPYQATLTVSSAGDFEVGEMIAIEYDPANPGHARPLEGWSPTYRSMWWYAAITLPVAAVGSVVTRRRLVRDAEVAASRDAYRMHGEPYRRRRWLHRKHLVALWPEEGDRLDAPTLSVEVETSLALPGPVSVVGGASPGDAVVLQADGETLWATSTLKAGIDPKAKPTRLNQRGI